MGCKFYVIKKVVFPTIFALYYLQTSLFILWCYGIKFLPTVITVLVSYAGVLSSHCDQMCSEPFSDLGPCRQVNNSLKLANCLLELLDFRCIFFYNPTGYRNITGGADVGGFEEGSWTLLTARLIVIFIVLLHFGKDYLRSNNSDFNFNINVYFSVVLSIGFVHRNNLIHRKSPHSNLIWLGTIFML